MKLKLLFILSFSIIITCVCAQRDFSNSDTTKVVLLGTGNPNPNPSQSGCSVAIVVNDTPYIVDFGAGLIRQAAAMSPRYGGKIKGLDVKNIKHAFLTHLHSDHTTGYPDLILTPWVMGRDEPLEVYGPEGIKDMTTNILKAYDDDIKYRLYGYEPANNQGWRVNSHEITKEGVIYEDENIKVEAFPVLHGTWPNAWGFRFTTPDKIIVLSGDTSPSEKIIEYASGADILIHEVYSQKGYDTKDDFWKNYHARNHTSTVQLADIANQAKPKLVVLYHILFWNATEEELRKEISAKYKGKVKVGKDLDVY
ncbi:MULTISPECIES: MBL fold metallo-hydrolase [unclassified Saccharicrinis]|uniref:MBL fold metallo-hydrolase n=1 Tax=unclassified Saccharicrinis TaxID=2646859 RepID=UPI003D3390CA